jgi:hypothetical protein
MFALAAELMSKAHGERDRRATVVESFGSGGLGTCCQGATSVSSSMRRSHALVRNQVNTINGWVVIRGCRRVPPFPCSQLTRCRLTNDTG